MGEDADGPALDSPILACWGAAQTLLFFLLRRGAALPLTPQKHSFRARSAHPTLELASVAEEAALCEVSASCCAVTEATWVRRE